MFTHALLVALALLANEALCNFHAGSIDQASNMGFSAVNVSCGDNECVACFETSFFKKPVLYTLEYSLNPYNVKFTADGGDYFWRFDLTQGEPSEPFRHCSEVLTEVAAYASDQSRATLEWRGDLCFDNNMSAVTVPSDCPNPLLMVTLDGVLQDKRMRGLQALFCKP